MIRFTSLYEKMILKDWKKTICMNVFCYKDGLVFPKYISDQKFENSRDSLFVTDGDKSHYMYIKDFDRFIFYKTKS